VAGLRQDGLIAPLVLDGAMNGESFLSYVRQLLVPCLRRGDIVIMDNLSSHKIRGVREAIEAVGASPGLDGELAIAQLVSQADLPVRRMSLLGAVEIGNPDRRTVSAQHLGDDTSAATLADDVDHHLVVLEHPVPAG